jgi:predicted nuclease with TOPRIM domain|tara:strand:- start:490 stop:801 length:312 start_codon:yes stop_codon:yes gene_type:complete
MDNYIQIVVTIIGVLGSASIWKYMEARLKARNENKKIDIKNNDGVQYRDDLKHRVRNLETLLAQSSDEKDELRDKVLKLTEEVSALRIKVEFLEKENQRLKNV